MNILEIGCGNRKRYEDSIGIDNHVRGEGILNIDLEDASLPFNVVVVNL
jgi:hypothetical protein